MINTAGSKIISIVPIDQRPYYWAIQEMREMSPEPDRFNIVGLDTESDFDIVGTHLSFFQKSPDSPRGIMRMYWPAQNVVEYSIIENMAEIRREHPEIVRRLLRNGIAAYNHRLNIEQKGNKAKFYAKLV